MNRSNFVNISSLKKFIREEKMTINNELLDILACPKCKGDIRLNESEDGIICDSCRLLYQIKDGIPVMLIEEAQKIED